MSLSKSRWGAVSWYPELVEKKTAEGARYNLTTIVVTVLIIGIFLALVVPGIYRAQWRARVNTCSSNLSGLWKMMHIYQSQFGGERREMPSRRGKEFWLAVENTIPPIVGWIDYENFGCPVKGGGIIGDLHYWGPGRPVSELGDTEPVGCDAMGEAPNHGEDGCNLLRKSGDVIEISALDWEDLDRSIGGGQQMTRPVP